MARKQIPSNGKLVVSLIYSSMDALADAVSALEKKFGPVEFETMEIETSQAQEYREEMGENLLRRFISFEKPVSRSSLVELKDTCFKIEPNFADKVGDFLFRTVNIDPCIITADNVVITSHRESNCNIYFKDGVFVEIALIYSRGTYRQLPWTMPDYCDPEAIDFFDRVRTSLSETEKEKETQIEF